MTADAPTPRLPNEFVHAGDLCTKSFADAAMTTTPTEHADWAVCNDCGETVNIGKGSSLGRGTVPEHRVPTP